MDHITVALCTFYQLNESMADASATLYALSNYHDIRDTYVIFFRNLIKLRTANINDYIHGNWTSHANAAMDAFAMQPARGLSLVETAHWANSIVHNLPCFNQPIEVLAETIRREMAYRLRFASGDDVDPSWGNDVSTARKSFCQVATPAP